MSQILRLITDDNKVEHLAVSTGLKSSAFKSANAAELKSVPGCLFNGTECLDWTVSGFREIDGIIHFYGPAVKGSLLSDVSPDCRLVGKLIKAFKLLDDRGYRTSQFSLRSVILTDDERLLFLPPLLMDFINSGTAENDKMEIIYPWNHPGLSGSQAKAFTIAAVAYKALTGTAAFRGDKRKEISIAVTGKRYASPLLEQPSIKPAIISLIDNSFSGNSTIDDWLSFSEDFISGELYDSALSPDEEASILSRARNIERARIRREHTTDFISHNKVKLIVFAAVGIALISILFSVLSNILALPATAGFNQKEVINLYYRSLDTMDFETMEDCVIGKVGKDDISQVMNMTALTRTRSAYETDFKLLNAVTWKSNGAPPLDSKSVLWGLDNIRVSELNKEDTYTVEYEKIFPMGNISSEEYYYPKAMVISDTIHLSETRHSWGIDSLERKMMGIIDYGSNN